MRVCVLKFVANVMCFISLVVRSRISLCGCALVCFEFHSTFLKSNKTFHVNLGDLQQKLRIHFLYEKSIKKSADDRHLSSAKERESSGVMMRIYTKNPFLELRLANYFILLHCFFTAFDLRRFYWFLVTKPKSKATE